MHRRRKLPENGVVIVLGARVVGASKTCPAHLSHAFQYRVDTAGVAPKRIFAEVNSETTLENLRFARDILRENGFSDTVLLATQSYHQWRACRMAKMLGLTPYPLHAKTNLKSLPKNLCREFLAILKFLLFTRKE